MIVDKVLKFGYGDIAVGSVNILQYITFIGFKPSKNCGERLNGDVEFTSPEIKIKISSFKKYEELCNLLDEVENHNISEFEFEGYVFNFDKFNIESIRVIRNHACRAMNTYIQLLAC